MIMSGAKDAVLQQVQFVDIHGTHYCDIVYTHGSDPQDSPDSPDKQHNEPLHKARIGKEDIYANPQPGDAVRVNYLMNVVTSVQRQD
jgi:hypothetical protein